MLDLVRYDFLLVVVGFSGLAFLVMRASKHRLPYPPGPKSFPVVGNLFSMPSQEEWVTYGKWAEELGSDIVHADVMGSHIIILNSIKAANELLEKRSSNYCDRPPLVVIKDLFGMDYNIGLLRYGTAWRHSRREFQANMGPADLEAYQPLGKQAVHRLLRNLLASPDKFAQHLRHMAGQVILSVAYGIDVLPENDPYVADAENVLRAITISTTKEALLLDFIPWLIKMPNWLPGARYKRYAREWCPIVASAVTTTYDKVKRELAAGTATPSVAAKLISKLDDDSTEEDLWVARTVPASMYLGGTDTTVSALETFILAMTLYPEVQRKAQTEIDRVVGNSRLPDFSDQDALPYVQAVLKEVLRWHPVLPLGAPRRAIASDIYEGYCIPAGSTIIPNAWGMMRDPAVFPEPDRFHPERWLSPDAPTFPNLAFGFGARQRPGRFLARASTWSNIAGILAAFDITPTKEGPPEEAYMSGVISFVKPFRCNILPRSAVAASLVRATESEG
ncbi:cytochrome P450 [Lactarius akahatsu]|uniref:Cytochrome P450 n=1 Tax=Lactarius akahatsu TaxID=416441 RepID=A0AAD4L589_9AGAM|nr:cytochrome P450 [Lactarius akahatsu]